MLNDSNKNNIKHLEGIKDNFENAVQNYLVEIGANCFNSVIQKLPKNVKKHFVNSVRVKDKNDKTNTD